MNHWLRRGENWGPGAERRTYSDAHWAKPARWNESAARAGQYRKVFPSVCDPFDNAAPAGARERFGQLILATPHLVWMLVAYHFKQWGEWAPGNLSAGIDLIERDRSRIKSGFFDYNGHWNPQGPNPFRQTMDRIGKKAAGRMLDGRIHDDFPQTSLPSIIRS